jgi:hypothetical protein
MVLQVHILCLCCYLLNQTCKIRIEKFCEGGMNDVPS